MLIFIVMVVNQKSSIALKLGPRNIFELITSIIESVSCLIQNSTREVVTNAVEPVENPLQFVSQADTANIMEGNQRPSLELV